MTPKKKQRYSREITTGSPEPTANRELPSTSRFGPSKPFQSQKSFWRISRGSAAAGGTPGAPGSASGGAAGDGAESEDDTALTAAQQEELQRRKDAAWLKIEKEYGDLASGLARLILQKRLDVDALVLHVWDQDGDVRARPRAAMPSFDMRAPPFCRSRSACPSHHAACSRRHALSIPPLRRCRLPACVLPSPWGGGSVGARARTRPLNAHPPPACSSLARPFLCVFLCGGVHFSALYDPPSGAG